MSVDKEKLEAYLVKASDDLNLKLDDVHKSIIASLKNISSYPQILNSDLFKESWKTYSEQNKENPSPSFEVLSKVVQELTYISEKKATPEKPRKTASQ